MGHPASVSSPARATSRGYFTARCSDPNDRVHRVDGAADNRKGLRLRSEASRTKSRPTPRRASPAILPRSKVLTSALSGAQARAPGPRARTPRARREPWPAYRPALALFVALPFFAARLVDLRIVGLPAFTFLVAPPEAPRPRRPLPGSPNAMCRVWGAPPLAALSSSAGLQPTTADFGELSRAAIRGAPQYAGALPAAVDAVGVASGDPRGRGELLAVQAGCVHAGSDERSRRHWSFAGGSMWRSGRDLKAEIALQGGASEYNS